MDAAERWAAAHLRAAPAGCFGKQITGLKEANIVGGMHVGIRLTREALRPVIPLTNKEFNGSSIGMSFRCGPCREDIYTGTASVFPPGSVQLVGAQNIPVFKIILHKFLQLLRANGFNGTMLNFSVDNIVSTGNFNFSVALHQMMIVPRFSVCYLPEDFPGLVCTSLHARNPVIALIFEGGRVMVLGITCMKAAMEQYLALRTVAELNKMPESVKLQRGKSLERSARLADEEDACIRDPTRSDKRVKLAAISMNALREFRETYPHLLDTEEGDRQMDKYIKNAIASARAAATASSSSSSSSASIKRRPAAAVAAHAKRSDDLYDDFDIYDYSFDRPSEPGKRKTVTFAAATNTGDDDGDDDEYCY
jgi:TATA-box binding protein (TBP) (component of TFIID and TFIIIB)